jgi:hypothetical protein
MTETTLRKTTKLEIGLVVLLLSQMGGAIWWARGVSAQLDTLTAAISKYDVGANAVLTYRVQQLEVRIAVLEARP